MAFITKQVEYFSAEMKILHVTSDLFPAVMGGIGVSVHEMAKFQAAEGHAVTIFTMN